MANSLFLHLQVVNHLFHNIAYFFHVYLTRDVQQVKEEKMATISKIWVTVTIFGIPAGGAHVHKCVRYARLLWPRVSMRAVHRSRVTMRLDLWDILSDTFLYQFSEYLNGFQSLRTIHVATAKFLKILSCSHIYDYIVSYFTHHYFLRECISTRTYNLFTDVCYGLWNIKCSW